MTEDSVIVFWDYASTHTFSASSTISNYELVANIRTTCLELGSIKSFRAYGNFSGQTSARISTAHSELAASGITVIDFPDGARKEAGIKAMLVDMITYAWDYPTGHTYVIISGDRDVSYAVAMLRMRRIKVVVISSVTAHPDLSAHASIKLDWTKTALGVPNGVPHFINPLDPKSFSSDKSTTPSFTQQSHTERPFGSQYRQVPSSAPPRKSFEATFEPESVELRDISPRGHRHSIFSAHDPHKFEGFGYIGDAPLTPKTQQELFGFGDGPLFLRPGEERPHAESVPPHVLYTSNLSKSGYPPFPETAPSFSTASAERGKAREFLVSELEAHPPPPKIDVPYSGSIFEPFTDTVKSSMSAFLSSECNAETKSRTSSSSSSQPITFSVMKNADTTAPTSARTEAADNYKPVVDSQADTQASQAPLSHTDVPVLSSATEVIPDELDLLPIEEHITNPSLAMSSHCSSTSTIEARPQITHATEHEPIRPVMEIHGAIRPLQPVAGPSQFAVPKSVLPNSGPAPKPASKPASTPTPMSASNPAPMPQPSVAAVTPSSFQPLIHVLRNDRAAIPKSALGEKLIKENPQVYQLAGVAKFKAYIAAAARAGIVSESKSGITLSAGYRT